MSIVLRFTGTICFLASFLMMMFEVYGIVLFMDVLAGILLLAIGAYTAEHKEHCNDDTTSISEGVKADR